MTSMKIDILPYDWKYVSLGEVIVDIGDGGTPSTKIKEYFNGDIPWVNIEDITKDIYNTKRHLTNLGLENSSAKLWNEGTVIFSFGASIGKVGIARVKLCTKQGIAGIVVNPKVIINEFLYYVLLKQAKKVKEIGHSMGSTIKEVRPSKLIKLITFPLPPLSEQKKIAEVLSTVDEAIAKVDEKIKKIERLKKGLMQRLLTKGIGHKEFKYSKELNCQIPKEWEVVKLIEVANIRQNKDISNLDAIAFIPMDLVSNSNIYVRYQVRKKESISSFTYCEAGDLLLAKITPSLENGKQGIVPNDIPNGVALATTEVFPIACENINNLFLFYILKYPKFRNQIIASMIGTTGRQRASKDSVINLKIPLPSGPEQQKIAEILSTVDELLELERRRKEKLERIKKGLMNDLLTGRKRVYF